MDCIPSKHVGVEACTCIAHLWKLSALGLTILVILNSNFTKLFNNTFQHATVKSLCLDWFLVACQLGLSIMQSGQLQRIFLGWVLDSLRQVIHVISIGAKFQYLTWLRVSTAPEPLFTNWSIWHQPTDTKRCDGSICNNNVGVTCFKAITQLMCWDQYPANQCGRGWGIEIACLAPQV